MNRLRQVLLFLMVGVVSYGYCQGPEWQRPEAENSHEAFQELRQLLDAQQGQIQAQQTQIEDLKQDLRRRDQQFEAMQQMLLELRGERPAAGTAAGEVVRSQTPGLADRPVEPHQPAFTQPTTTETTGELPPPVLTASTRPVSLPAQRPRTVEIPIARGPEPEEPGKWYDRISLRGYTQFRYNRLLETNPLLTCEQCDRSIGGNNGIAIRRARLVFSGDLNDRVSMYFQPDFASSGGGLNFGQIRDLYFDVNLDREKEFRIRVGQSKIPFGFENLQSSSNRLSLDRSDSLNSAILNERDLALLFFYAPKQVRARFRHLTESGLKGSGDYGMGAVGLFNGQSANRAEGNDGLHKVARISYPFQLGKKQILEPGIQGYTGEYSIAERGATTTGPAAFRDARAAMTLVLYPQPFGFQAEYNIGRGPAYNPQSNTIEDSHLMGGYAQLMYRRRVRDQYLTAFVKGQYYDGGKKFELDARRYLVREQEFGVEWQMNPALELTASYGRSDRTTHDSRNPWNRQKGNLMRLQLQFNY
ncbi:MAG: porin [Candidatus Korobacteraceae bacterium]